MNVLLVYFSLFILAIILLICLVGSLLGSSSAFFWAIVTSAVIALILYSENQRKKAKKKRQEEARQQAIAEAQKRAILEREKTLVEARNRPNLFTFNPSTDLDDIISHTQRKNPVQWAAAIQKRYEAAKSSVDDSVMVVNDDVEQLRVYREKLHKGVMRDYEIAIQPFKEKLDLIEDKIPQPKELKMAENYTFPVAMQPMHIRVSLYEPISDAMSSMGNSSHQIGKLISDIMNRGGFSNTTNVAQVSVVGLIVGIKLAIGLVNQKKEVARTLTELQEVEADVDKYCVQMAGAIQSMGVAASEITHLRQLHDRAVDYMAQYYDAVKEISEQGKLLEHLEDNEIQAIESFYMGGKQLARLMKVDVMKSTS
jgi:type II secretory pathway pseudopilin PulG